MTIFTRYIPVVSEQTITGSVITLPSTPAPGKPVTIYVNGLVQAAVAITSIVGTTVTLVASLVSANVIINYYEN